MQAELEDDGERMIPAVHRGSLIYAEHYTRYLVAQDLVRGKRVLDIASGSGYGSHLLSSTAASVIGVDRDADAVAYARDSYSAPNLEYRQGDAVAIPVDDASVDVLITFETIEHVEDYRAFLRECDRVLAPDGVAVISTPNELEFAEGNHFHLHEFVADELDALVREHFDHVAPYYQATWKAVAIGTEESFTTEGPWTTPVLNLAPLEPEQFLYFYLLCSRRPLTESVPPLVALGGHYSDRSLVAGHLANLGTVERLESDAGRLTAEVQRLDAEVQRLDAQVAEIAAELARSARSLDDVGGELSARTAELADLRRSRAYRVAQQAGATWARVRGRG